MESDFGDADATLHFQLQDGVVKLRLSDLQEIKKTLIRYIREPDENFEPYSEFQEVLLQETEKLPCWINDETAHVGRWILEERNRQLVLVRNPPRNDIMYVLLAFLSKSDSTWNISNFSHERMVAR